MFFHNAFVDLLPLIVLTFFAPILTMSSLRLRYHLDSQTCKALEFDWDRSWPHSTGSALLTAEMNCSDVNVFGMDLRTLPNTPSNKTENCEYSIIHRFSRSPAITSVYIYESAEHRFRLLFRGLWLPLQNKRLTITPHPTDMLRSHEWPRNIKDGRSVRSSSFASENCHIHETGQCENTFANMYVGVTDTAKIYNILKL